MILSVAGCGKKESMSPNSQSTSQPSTQSPDSDWKISGSDEVGYAEVPAGWIENMSQNGDAYALQYVNVSMDGLFSFIYNQYGYNNEETAQSPVDIVMSEHYGPSYANLGAENLSTEEVRIDGETFTLRIDCIPAGSYTDYDYYMYTYIAFKDQTFYTVIIEGRESAIKEVVEHFEATYKFP